MLSAALVGPGIFFSASTIIVVHILEWIDIASSWRRFGNTNILLRGGLTIEILFYFSLLIVWVVFFPERLIFLILIALLGIVHLAALQATISQKIEKWLSQRGKESVVGVMTFEAIEVGILIALAFQFHPSALRLF
jgi:hypothetical protein